MFFFNSTIFNYPSNGNSSLNYKLIGTKFSKSNKTSLTSFAHHNDTFR